MRNSHERFEHFIAIIERVLINFDFFESFETTQISRERCEFVVVQRELEVNRQYLPSSSWGISREQG